MGLTFTLHLDFSCDGDKYSLNSLYPEPYFGPMRGSEVVSSKFCGSTPGRDRSVYGETEIELVLFPR